MTIDKKEKARIYNREYTQRPDVKLRHKEQQKLYYQRHKQEILDKFRKRYNEIKDWKQEQNSNWHYANRDKVNARHQTNQIHIRKLFIKMYGEKCVCCGESNYEFLTIEHKHGQVGKKKEGSYRAYRNAIKEYLPDVYEILCMNCNFSKGKYGYCPHNPPR